MVFIHLCRINVIIISVFADSFITTLAKRRLAYTLWGKTYFAEMLLFSELERVSAKS